MRPVAGPGPGCRGRRRRGLGLLFDLRLKGLGLRVRRRYQDLQGRRPFERGGQGPEREPYCEYFGYLESQQPVILSYFQYFQRTMGCFSVSWSVIWATWLSKSFQRTWSTCLHNDIGPTGLQQDCNMMTTTFRVLHGHILPSY